MALQVWRQRDQIDHHVSNPISKLIFLENGGIDTYFRLYLIKIHFLTVVFINVSLGHEESFNIVVRNCSYRPNTTRSWLYAAVSLETFFYVWNLRFTWIAKIKPKLIVILTTFFTQLSSDKPLREVLYWYIVYMWKYCVVLVDDIYGWIM